MIGIDITSEDSISVLTQYSNTPNCLIEFLNKHLKVA